ncbi:amine acid ABC transporter, permease protein, 3-TM region, His/Glu/Gln/Arg/opine family [Polaromonas sp. YR568]|uniref:ABC transporter permease subunit n=1 Tax=Polaromonas sp. YR568 TaxID=1855301 RepID=UPI0008E97599|nr:ABC transporter permease subunit [Polaromonas sp. YR568]SFU94628.1 amine acid ABC transporter, permease protein, 3-TM region, His/Glu/Gln/Arg/opine family [Polaromonas sp. YR568]
MLDVLARFLPDFFSGLVVNFQIAICALLGGLLLGAPLALARFRNGLASTPAAWLVALLRTVPTFVVMFFLVNVVPATVALGQWHFAMSPWLAVVLSLTLYAAAYVSDHAVEAMRQLRSGSPVAAMLFVTGLVRAFFVMVLSSGFGAAVGVVEATTITLRAIETLPKVSDRLILIGLVIVIFTVCFQLIYLVINHWRGKLNQRFHRPIQAARLEGVEQP